MIFISTVISTASVQSNQTSTLFIVVSATTSVMALILIVMAFVLGMLAGRKANATLSTAQIREEDTPTFSETSAGIKLEKAHEYEDIVLGPRDVNTYMNNAYGL